VRAIVANQPTERSEHTFESGAILSIANYMHDGYFEGKLIQFDDAPTNGSEYKKQNSREMRYPKFKVHQRIEAAPFRAFDDVNPLI